MTTTTPRCRLCDASLTIDFADLGSTPLANSYLGSVDDFAAEKWYPLHARVCSDCLLVQVESVVPAEHIFSDYAYFSSYSSSWLVHCADYCDMVTKRFALDASSFIVEVASNDGYLLKNFVANGIPVLGVEPAANVAAVAVGAGVPTEVAFFGEDTAKRMVASNRHADLIAANNVFAHVPDLNDFTAGFSALLAEQGVLTIEFPHLLRQIEGMQFDTIYHEHYSYYSLLSASNVLLRHGLRVFDVDELPTHGGSLRIYACHIGALHEQTPNVAKVLHDERAERLDVPSRYPEFGAKVRAVQSGLVRFLNDERTAGRRVVAYGAAAKGNTLLNTSGVDTTLIEYVVDKNPHKQGQFLPGSHLPIFDPAKILEDRPDTVLILPWNIADEVTSQMVEVRGWGGSFVVAVPEIQRR